MNQTLQRFRHYVRAKGRHGTHSPFVYAFVEQVLRSKTKFVIGNYEGIPFSSKEINLLIRALVYLDAKTVYADEAVLPLLQQIQQSIVLEVLSIKQAEIPDGAILISLCQNVENHHDVFTKKNITVILLRPHSNALSERTWKALSNIENLKMTLDVWHFGLLLNGQAFKGKQQYFRLHK